MDIENTYDTEQPKIWPINTLFIITTIITTICCVVIFPNYYWIIYLVDIIWCIVYTSKEWTIKSAALDETRIKIVRRIVVGYTILSAILPLICFLITLLETTINPVF